MSGERPARAVPQAHDEPQDRRSPATPPRTASTPCTARSRARSIRSPPMRPARSAPAPRSRAPRRSSVRDVDRRVLRIAATATAMALGARERPPVHDPRARPHDPAVRGERRARAARSRRARRRPSPAAARTPAAASRGQLQPARASRSASATLAVTHARTACGSSARGSWRTSSTPPPPSHQSTPQPKTEGDERAFAGGSTLARAIGDARRHERRERRSASRRRNTRWRTARRSAARTRQRRTRSPAPTSTTSANARAKRAFCRTPIQYTPAASTAHSAAVQRSSNANGIAIVAKMTASARNARDRSATPGSARLRSASEQDGVEDRDRERAPRDAVADTRARAPPAARIRRAARRRRAGRRPGPWRRAVARRT